MLLKGEAYSRRCVRLSVHPSGPYLEKYKRDCNGTWFIDIWQYEEGQCTLIIILPGIFTELSPLNHLFFIMDACPSHIFKILNEMKIGL